MAFIIFIFLLLCSFTTNKLAISSIFPSAPPQEIFAVPGENNDCVTVKFIIDLEYFI